MQLIKVIKERWIFYLVPYVVGYLIALKATGVPNIVYLVPIKLSAIAFTIGIGNALYHAFNGVPTYRFPLKGMKYVGIIAIIMILFNLLRIILLYVGLDLTPFIGY